MLIRHNVRTGSNQSAHFAHDTDRHDVNGCYVSGQQGKFYTTSENKCPQCGGYGALVPIVQLPRSEYPAGSVVPEAYRLHQVNVPTTGMANSAMSAQAVDPVQAMAFVDPVQAMAFVQDPGPEPVRSIPTPVTEITRVMDEQAARDMATAMLAAIVPEATRIRETITQAVDEVRVKVSDANAQVLADTVNELSARFDETVKRLIVPTTIRIERENREPVVLSGTVHNAFVECLEWLQARDADGRPRNLYLTGPAGCGKTTLAKQLAQALDVPFYTTGQVLSEHQVTGYSDAGGTYHTTPFREAFQGGGLWLGDEWDAWSPEATLAANGALANGHASFPDTPGGIDAHRDFYVIAAANTWGNGADREYVGRNEMDKASISRFVTVPMDYDQALETEIAGPWGEWLALVWKVRENARELRMRVMVGTREIVHGVAGLNAGMTLERVTERILRRNMTDAEWEKASA